MPRMVLSTANDPIKVNDVPSKPARLNVSVKSYSAVVLGALSTCPPAILVIHWLSGVPELVALDTHGLPETPGVVFCVGGSGQFKGEPLNGLLLKAWNPPQFGSAAPLVRVVPELATRPVLKKTPPGALMVSVLAESGKTVKKQSMHSKATGTRRFIVVFRDRLIVVEVAVRIF